jgi:alkylhydroperoxidase family enzyme
MSRFPIHDELTAPEGSLPVLRGALGRGGQLPNFLGVLAGAPAALRGYARLRSELRNGHLALPTLERIALAVHHRHGSTAGVVLHERTARRAGLKLDDVALAKRFDARDPKEAALLRWLEAVIERTPPAYLHEEAREAGWTDEELLEAIAYVSLETFTALVTIAGDVPADGSVEASRQLRAA